LQILDWIFRFAGEHIAMADSLRRAFVIIAFSFATIFFRARYALWLLVPGKQFAGQFHRFPRP